MVVSIHSFCGTSILKSWLFGNHPFPVQVISTRCCSSLFQHCHQGTKAILWPCFRVFNFNPPFCPSSHSAKISPWFTKNDPQATIPTPKQSQFQASSSEMWQPRHQNCQYYAVDQALVAHRSTALYGSPKTFTTAVARSGGSSARSVHRLRRDGKHPSLRAQELTQGPLGLEEIGVLKFDSIVYRQDCWILMSFECPNNYCIS
jgi:hypothetical protein